MEFSSFKPNSVKSQIQKKRKGNASSKTNVKKDQFIEGSKSSSDVDCKRQIHSKIEKRRRDKMNTYITHLSTMIPSCNFAPHKLDKITVLRMAVQYLKSIRSSPMQYTAEENLKYSFISDMELKRLILQVAEGFLFVVGCESGRILYVSQSVSTILSYNQTELLGRSLYDVIHPSDIDKVKEQISCVDLNPRHKLMGLKSTKELNVDFPSEQLGLHPGNRRSFYFRVKSDIDNLGKYVPEMRNFSSNAMNEFVPLINTSYNSDENQYTIIHCVGYLKCWNSTNNNESDKEGGEDQTSLTCLIAIGRTMDNLSQGIHIEKPSNFMSKHSVDGKFLFVDHWVTLITGYLPQEILGTSIYEYIHSEDVNEFAEAHRLMLQPFYCGNTIKNYRFRTKYSNFISVQSEWKSLHNPWKKDVEYFYSKNMVNWSNETKFTENKSGEKESSVIANESFTISNFHSDKEEQNLMSDFNFHNTICEKNNNEATMEAILKLLESDPSIGN